MSTSIPTDSTPTLTVYDILMRQPVQQNACSPNPTKARLTLNFKSIPYKTTWVDLPDVASTRKSLDIPAGRKFADGSEFYTLPVLVDSATGSKIGDSFDIAVYMHETYPSAGGTLFPEGADVKLDFRTSNTAMLVPLSDLSETARQEKYVRYAEFNTHVDAAFTAHTILNVMGIPFNPDTEEVSKAEFCRRAGMPSFEAFDVTGEARKGIMASFKETLGDLARVFGRDTSGPFILGSEPCYADFIVGGWLRMFSVCLPGEEWEEVRGWHGGVFGALFDGLRGFYEIK
ncbi:glutathione S-transferase family protein [Aspergillus mulundensis]|uniref:GST N-terminal domain-containing protein n=1 Tax=Aspergillus mulundensis TaxID=1810919 RepID=A0A3D8QSC6_9EURO|nr:Uncharacterized protein DSM5745_09805 [Aspergillus mulundensis]RDW64394.1 Uncharacterized protein DSM5745_09805 [Aspergillus mulundensis]